MRIKVTLKELLVSFVVFWWYFLILYDNCHTFAVIATLFDAIV
ncbi:MULTISPECIES: hypothetical protein [unclassified Lacinutrix]